MSTILETTRLILRPLRAADISRFLPLLRDYEVAKNLSRVPHPYTEDDACAFVVFVAAGWRSGNDFTFEILLKERARLIGVCGVHPRGNWEVGYWLGRPYWGCGFATEAIERLVTFAFEARGAEKLAASWLYDNPASGRVLEKLGYLPEGEEIRPCLSRGTNVLCHKVGLTRAAYEQRKALQ